MQIFLLLVLPRKAKMFVLYQRISSIVFKRRRYRPLSLRLTLKSYFWVSYDSQQNIRQAELLWDRKSGKIGIGRSKVSPLDERCQATSQPRRTETLITPLWKTQNSYLHFLLLMYKLRGAQLSLAFQPPEYAFLSKFWSC